MGLVGLIGNCIQTVGFGDASDLSFICFVLIRWDANYFLPIRTF
jgi:hypothetical protein